MAWISTGQPGVRYREHATRRHLGQADRYYALRYYVNGKGHEEGLGWAHDGWTTKKAAAVLAELRRAQATGSGPQTLAELRAAAQARMEEDARAALEEKAQDMTLEQFLVDHYMPHAKKKKGSWRTDEIRIHKTIIPALGHMPMRAMTTADVNAFLDAVADGGAAPATVVQYMALLRQAYNIAAMTSIDGVPILTGQSPLHGIKAPQLFNARVGFLSYDDADRLTDAAKSKSQDLHDAIVISLNTGMRKGEVMRMEWQDVDLVHGIIIVRDGPKQKPGGIVHINPEVEGVLSARKDGRAKPHGKVFPGVKGEERDISRSFAILVRELGLNEGVTDRRNLVVFHTLRHTFASWLAMAGTDILRIKALMRHKTLAMTERYAHLIPDATKAAVHNLRPPRAS